PHAAGGGEAAGQVQAPGVGTSDRHGIEHVELRDEVPASAGPTAGKPAVVKVLRVAERGAGVGAAVPAAVHGLPDAAAQVIIGEGQFPGVGRRNHAGADDLGAVLHGDEPVFRVVGVVPHGV